MAIERPASGGHVALPDDALAKIGLAVVYESSAKSAASAALRALANLDERRWRKLEKWQFGQIMSQIENQLPALDDAEIFERFARLRSALDSGHEPRHLIVHVSWGEGGEGYIGYDYIREREVHPADIDVAVESCAELKCASHSFTMRVAELIIDGKIPERTGSVGMSMCVGDRWVRL